MNKCASTAGRFNCHADVWVQCCLYCPMQHVHSFPGSHWMLPLGNYLLHDAPAAARVTANKTTMKKWTNFSGQFDGCGGALVQYRTDCLIEEI
jgi:hypothetical protein